MTREGYERLLAIFEAACARAVDDRAAFLAEVWAGKSALRCESTRCFWRTNSRGDCWRQPRSTSYPPSARRSVPTESKQNSEKVEWAQYFVPATRSSTG